MLTWLYGADGRAAAILDEFCIRSAAGEPAGWIFGLSVFSLRGEHIGWFEQGVLFDVDNHMLGFIPGQAPTTAPLPVTGIAPALPPLPKRPHVPTLRARPVRQPCGGWSTLNLADYLHHAAAAQPAQAIVPGSAGGARGTLGDIPR